ncbi:hypothetical protein [Solilutibacter silvestris]|uniref:hypothetical protein n=1 Tax=Solilutibacter silvestris TaxID=1645665 RepID=UPI000CA08D41|nr:hypothetical protein [Lysobacter silvestris]
MFAALMVDAPEFSMHGQSIEEAFEAVQLGIDSVVNKSKSKAAIKSLQFCKEQLKEIEHIFLENSKKNDPEVRKATRHRLQRLYYEHFREIGPMLKPGFRFEDIGPDDDV